MPNIASILKSEMSRVARKELRGEVASLRKAVSTHRSEIAALKRRTRALESEVHRLGQVGSRFTPRPSPELDFARLRFTAKGLVSQRKRLGLSAHDYGLLIGASAQSISNWETGKARPREKYLPAIAALRSIGKKEATTRLETLKA